MFDVLSSIRAIWCRNGTRVVPNFLARRRRLRGAGCPTVRGGAVHQFITWRGRIRHLNSARGRGWTRRARGRPVEPPSRRVTFHSGLTSAVESLSSLNYLRLSSMTSLDSRVCESPLPARLPGAASPVISRVHARCTPHPPQSVVSDHNSRTWKSHPQAH